MMSLASVLGCGIWPFLIEGQLYCCMSSRGVLCAVSQARTRRRSSPVKTTNTFSRKRRVRTSSASRQWTSQAGLNPCCPIRISLGTRHRLPATVRPAGEDDGRDEGAGRDKKDNDTEVDFRYNRHDAVSLCGGCIG